MQMLDLETCLKDAEFTREQVVSQMDALFGSLETARMYDIAGLLQVLALGAIDVLEDHPPRKIILSGATTHLEEVTRYATTFYGMGLKLGTKIRDREYNELVAFQLIESVAGFIVGYCGGNDAERWVLQTTERNLFGASRG